MTDILSRLYGAARRKAAVAEATQPAPNGVRNDLQIQFFGLRRSGNHAVIAWIAQQYRSPVVFLNNARPFRDPYLNYLMGRVPNAVPTRKMTPAEAEELRGRRKSLLLGSYEDVSLRKIARKPVIPDQETTIGQSACVHRALLIRDFYNWIASRIRLLENKGAAPDTIVGKIDGQTGLWLTYAREAVGETNCLGVSQCVSVLFNRWFDDESYRADVLGRLAIPVMDNSISVVPRAGGGSSFDGTLFSGNAAEMDLLNRWAYLCDQKYEAARGLLGRRREEIEFYNQKLFGLRCPFAG